MLVYSFPKMKSHEYPTFPIEECHHYSYWKKMDFLLHKT
nr:MAG TPA: hypothetical protein [Caudoviricetes sp.]